MRERRQKKGEVELHCSYHGQPAQLTISLKPKQVASVLDLPDITCACMCTYCCSFPLLQQYHTSHEWSSCTLKCQTQALSLLDGTMLGVQEVFVVQPPLSMISSCIQQGKLTIRLADVRSRPLAPPCTVQVGFYRCDVHPFACFVALLEHAAQSRCQCSAILLVATNLMSAG